MNVSCESDRRNLRDATNLFFFFLNPPADELKYGLSSHTSTYQTQRSFVNLARRSRGNSSTSREGYRAHEHCTPGMHESREGCIIGRLSCGGKSVLFQLVCAMFGPRAGAGKGARVHACVV